MSFLYEDIMLDLLLLKPFNLNLNSGFAIRGGWTF